MENSLTGDDRIDVKRRYVNEYLDNTREEREWAELHRDYFDDKQWTATEISILNQRGQPVITDNKIKDKVEYMEGVERKTRTDPKAFPRTEMHEEDADVATDSIRYVFDDNRFQITKSAVFQNLLIEGFGGCEVIVDKDDPKSIIIRKIRWDRLIRDPYSMEADCSDARYLGFVTWMDQDYAKHKFEVSADKLETTYNYNGTHSNGETLDDKPNWIDAKRKRVAIYTIYEKRKGKIYLNVFCWAGNMEPEAECAYEDDDGEHEWPIVVASAYIDREGRRYGLVKRYVSLQDEINKRRSKSLHLLNSAFLITEKGAVDDPNKARQEVAKPDGMVVVTPTMRFDVERNLELSAGHFQLLQQAEAALSVTGPNAALLGNSGSISGRAKELDQQGGALQIGVLFDSIRDWQLRVAKQAWNRIRQYWDEEMIVRVTDSENASKFVTLNEPMTKGDMTAKALKKQKLSPEELEQRIQALAQDPEAKMKALDAKGRQIKNNDVSQLDVDIILDESPDIVTVQSENFDRLARLAETKTIAIPPDALIEMAGLRSDLKKRVLDTMKGVNDPAAAQMAQFQQMMQQLEGLLKQAEVRETNASADLKQAQAEKTAVESVTKVAEATSPQENRPAQGLQ